MRNDSGGASLHRCMFKFEKNNSNIAVKVPTSARRRFDYNVTRDKQVSLLLITDGKRHTTPAPRIYLDC